MTLTLNLQTVLIFCCLALPGCRDEEFKTYPPPPLIIEGHLVEMGSYVASGSVYAGIVVEDAMTRKWLTASIYTVNDGTENVDLSFTEVDIITHQTEAVRSAIYPDWIQAKKNKLYKVTLNLHEYGSFSELNNVKSVTAYSDGETIWQMMVDYSRLN